MDLTGRLVLVVDDEVDLLDVGGPYEVFLTASRLAVRDGKPPPFEVMTIGMGRAPVRSYGGMGLIPTHTFDEIDELTRSTLASITLETLVSRGKGSPTGRRRLEEGTVE